jgi:hypothetical protein
VKLLGNIFSLLLAASVTYLLIRTLLDGVQPKHKGRTPGLNDELDEREERIAGGL